MTFTTSLSFVLIILCRPHGLCSFCIALCLLLNSSYQRMYTVCGFFYSLPSYIYIYIHPYSGPPSQHQFPFRSWDKQLKTTSLCISCWLHRTSLTQVSSKTATLTPVLCSGSMTHPLESLAVNYQNTWTSRVRDFLAVDNYQFCRKVLGDTIFVKFCGLVRAHHESFLHKCCGPGVASYAIYSPSWGS